MREGKPSFTALAVAVARGIGTTAHDRDPSAAELVPPALGRALAWLGRPAAPGVVRSALRVASLGMVDHVSLRRAAIDAALLEAIDAGATQLVVLGAGLDGRAWRLDALRGLTVFEVDHPSTQADKQRRVSGRPATAADVRFVAVDFEHDALGERLAAEGHDPAQRSVWIWEGVTPYLHPSAIKATLADVAARSATGSRLLVTYAIPQLTGLGSPTVAGWIRAGFAVLGEPLHGTIDREAFADTLANHGFAVLDDSSNRRWAQRHGGSARMASPFWAERLVIAESVSRS